MADTYSRQTRSYTMSRIRKTDTKPELIVRKFLFSQGLRYRLYNKKLPGNPDIVLHKYKTVVLINGCFWHAHENCKLNRMPKSNIDYWIPKIQKNVARDKINETKLNELGWKVLTIWECELKSHKKGKTLLNLYNKITKTIDEVY